MLYWVFISLLVSTATIQASPTPDDDFSASADASFEASASFEESASFDESASFKESASFEESISGEADFDESISISGEGGFAVPIEAVISGDSSIYTGPNEWSDDCDCRLGDNAYYDDLLYISRRYQDFLAVKDFQKFVQRTVDKVRLHYYNSGSDNETTVEENELAFQRLRLRPRVLRGVGVRDTTTQILGDDASFPLGIGIGANEVLRWVDPNGEIGVAKAAECEGVPYIVSAFSSTDLEEVALHAPQANLWMETYIFFDRSITQSIVERAEASGYRAIVVSVGTPVAPNLLDSAHDHVVLPEYIRLPNIENDESNAGFEHLNEIEEDFFDDDINGNNRNYFHRHHVLSNIELVKGRGYFKTTKVDQRFERYEKCIGSFLLSDYYNYLVNPEASWDDLRWITTLTDLPIVVRGILTGCDAVRAVESGVSAIIVSNNAGRSVDTAPATIEALAEVLEAVDVYPNVEVYMEGGVRWGTDIFKAVAMGADAVFISRPVTWGMLHSGKCGVRRVLQVLRSEFDRDMAFMGTKDVNEITSTMIVSQNYYTNRFRPDDVDIKSNNHEDALECPFGYDYDEAYQQELSNVNDYNLVRLKKKFRNFV